MIPSNPIEQIFNYAGNAQYCNLPTPEQMSAGVVPLDSLPASWWNKMWADTTSRITEAREAVGIMINELCNVLVAAGVCPQCNCLDQLYQSIDVIRKTLATATCPGAVVSSSDANKVAVASDGTMTVNCFGNAASLTTSARTITGAINELKSTYDNALTNMGNTVAGKAPISHASADATYGVGTASAYGHLKISDQYTSVLAACSGVAASQKAVADVYAYAANIAAGVSILGNTVAVMDGTASAGICNTAARSDHVHPWPNLSGSMWYHADRWDGLMTAHQTDQAYCGTGTGWASYLTFTHSTVAAEYYQQIRFPFWSPPQVHRVEGGVDRGWQTIYTTENSCVGAYANTGVVRDGCGHIYANYLNTGNGRENPGDFPNYSLAFVDAGGWHRKADPMALYTGWADRSRLQPVDISAHVICISTYADFIWTNVICCVDWDLRCVNCTVLYAPSIQLSVCISDSLLCLVKQNNRSLLLSVEYCSCRPAVGGSGSCSEEQHFFEINPRFVDIISSVRCLVHPAWGVESVPGTYRCYRAWWLD